MPTVVLLRLSARCFGAHVLIVVSFASLTYVRDDASCCMVNVKEPRCMLATKITATATLVVFSVQSHHTALGVQWLSHATTAGLPTPRTWRTPTLFVVTAIYQTLCLIYNKGIHKKQRCLAWIPSHCHCLFPLRKCFSLLPAAQTLTAWPRLAAAISHTTACICTHRALHSY